MKFFIDTEFIERPFTIELISIGIVSEDDRELYLVNKDADLSHADDFVINEVLAKMPEYDKDRNKIRPSGSHVVSMEEIGKRVIGFCGKAPVFWGYFCDYDWVIFCWIFGRMIDLPPHFPMYCRDLKQMMDAVDCKNIKQQDDDTAHNALQDAIWIKQTYNHLKDVCHIDRI